MLVENSKRNSPVMKNPSTPKSFLLKGKSHLLSSAVKSPDRNADEANRRSADYHQQADEDEPNNQLNSSNEAQAPQQASPRKVLVESEEKVNLVENNNWLSPLSTGQVLWFKFVYENKSGVTRYKMRQNHEDNFYFEALVNGSVRESGVQFFFNKKEVGMMNYNHTAKTMSAGLLVEESEICAIVVNQLFANASQPKIFDFVVPALKKKEGKNVMINIKYTEQSGLILRLTQKSKEAIKLKSRVPMNQGAAYDMTFNGLFQEQSLSNFILYHASNAKRDICTFGLTYERNTYDLRVQYPLSPMQAFVAAVTSMAPW